MFAQSRYATFLVVLMITVTVWPMRAGAIDVSDADRSTFRTIISGQIDAFRRDDGAAAFAYASPMIRSIFRTPDAFVEMVRRGYMPVYRPRRVDFGPVTDELGAPTQRVDVVGPDGSLWTALYAMERQPDGTWRISSVVLIRSTGESV